MKHLKIFENKNNKWTENRIKNLIKETNDLDILLTLYLEHKDEPIENINYYYFNNENTLTIMCYDPDGEYIAYEVDNIKDMLRFINNPEFYEEQKKYNL